MVQVIKVRGPVVLEFADGTQIQITPAHGATVGTHTRGRPSSPATLAVRAAMEADRAAGRRGDRAEYLAAMRKAGHRGGDISAYVIINREAKRAFGVSLGRSKKRRAAPSTPGKRGRKAAPETFVLRSRLLADKAAGQIRDAKFYLRWLMDQPGTKLGIKPARPIVYRELRAIKG